MSHHVTPCHTMSHHVTPCHTTPVMLTVPESGECSPANVGADVSPRRNHGFHSSMGRGWDRHPILVAPMGSKSVEACMESSNISQHRRKFQDSCQKMIDTSMVFHLNDPGKGASTFAPTGSIFLQLFFFSVFSGRHWVSLVLSAKGLMPFFLAKAIGVDFQRRNHAWLSTSCWGLGSAESCDAHPIGCFSLLV